ncbi:2-dehydropantoate 2-reductase [Proteobacteria bacterium 005FR1]|nr:2-dehydropantoate 2-reductase [Proteobacteria bacterium 005FR1]
MSSPVDTVHILGAGSIGLMLAAHLSRVVPVTLIRRPGMTTPELRFRFREGNNETIVTLPQQTTETLDAAIERVIVCTKAQDALAAVESVADYLTEGSGLLLMQNGMGSQEAIVDRFPGLSIHAASSTEGAYREPPDTVVHAGRGITRIGGLTGKAFDWTALFQTAGLDAEQVEQIEWHLGNKLRINCLINPLTVLYDCRNGELLAIPAALEQMRRLGTEADAVLAAAGFTFSEPAFDVARQVARATANNRSSMLQDASAGRALELDYMTGYLLALAERCGVSAEEHRAVYQQITKQV